MNREDESINFSSGDESDADPNESDSEGEGYYLNRQYTTKKEKPSTAKAWDTDAYETEETLREWKIPIGDQEMIDHMGEIYPTEAEKNSEQKAHEVQDSIKMKTIEEAKTQAQHYLTGYYRLYNIREKGVAWTMPSNKQITAFIDKLNKYPSINTPLYEQLGKFDEVMWRDLKAYRKHDSMYETARGRWQQERKNVIWDYQRKLGINMAMYGMPKEQYKHVMRWDDSSAKFADQAKRIHREQITQKMPILPNEGKTLAPRVPGYTELYNKYARGHQTYKAGDKVTTANQDYIGKHREAEKSIAANNRQTLGLGKQTPKTEAKKPAQITPISAKEFRNAAMLSLGYEANKVLADILHKHIIGEPWDWQPYIKWVHKRGTMFAPAPGYDYSIKYKGRNIKPNHVFREAEARAWIDMNQYEMMEFIRRENPKWEGHEDYKRYSKYITDTKAQLDSLQPKSEKRQHRLINNHPDKEEITRALKRGPEFRYDSQPKRAETVDKDQDTDDEPIGEDEAIYDPKYDTDKPTNQKETPPAAVTGTDTERRRYLI